MTEPKRLPFTTLNGSEKDKKVEKFPPTVRFTLSLDLNNGQQCAEFSYADLLKKSLGEKKPVENGDDPFGDDEDQEALAAIAKKFEEKYNPKTAKWKKKHGRIQDLVDLGEGYDENDDFIDNSEAYDEVVPACLTTKLGGFYINCGKLDFKEISDDSDDDFKLGTLKKKKKKRKIISDSESDGEKKDEEKKIKKRKLKDGVEIGEKKKKKLMNGEGKKEFKKPKNPDKAKKKSSPNASDPHKQNSDSTASKDTKQNGRITPDVNSQSSQDGNASSQDEGIDSIIDSVIAMSKNDKLDAVFDSVLGMGDSNSNDNDSKKPESIPKLPDGLTPEFNNVLEKLKEIAKSSSVGKGKFFSDEVNDMLLDVELTTRQLPCSQRSSIFGHLAAFLPCTKDTLLKRAKKLRVNRQEDQLKGPMERLKAAIDEVMPSLLEKHEAEIQIWKQKQAENEANKEESRPEGKEGDTEDSEEEGEKTNAEQPTSTKKKVAAPKKKFEWNENLRTLLCDLVKVKMKIYDYMKTRTQTAEEYLRTFLDKEVKVLWPKGWMQASVLLKESRPAHVAWTNPTKIKKVPIINKTSHSANTTPVGPPKQGTTPNTAPGPIIKQSVAPGSAPPSAGMYKQGVNSGSTPVRTLGASDASKLGRTLLDYANESCKSESEKMMQERNRDSNSASSLGLSLLASSAATQKYAAGGGERSWDHKVSDILRTTDSKKESSYIQQFQNYASTVFKQQLGKDESKTSPTKNSTPIQNPQSLLQIKPQDAQNMVQKLKAAQMPKQTPQQTSPQSHNKQLLATFLSQKTTGASSVSYQEVYKQLLAEREKQLAASLPHSGGGGEGKAKTSSAPQVKKVKTVLVGSNTESSNPTQPKTIIRHSPTNSASMEGSKKPVYVRSISQGSVSMPGQIQGQQRISPTSSNISTQRVSPQGQISVQRHSPSKSNNNYQNANSMSNSAKGEATATNLLQSLFGQIDQHARQKSPSPSGVVNRSTPPQNKSGGSPIWSMTSIVQSQTGNAPAKTSPTYAIPGLPKPQPGYQSVKLTNFNREPALSASPHSPTMKSLLHNTITQGISGQHSSNYVPTSPLLQGQPGTSLTHQAGFFPPYTTSPQTGYPYGSYYTGKSSNSSSHGY